MTPEQLDFITRAKAQAESANHPFPLMAACEAALESDYGTSRLAKEANNLLGMKQHVHAIYGTFTLPTREFDKQRGWVVIMANWVKYPDWRACFADRLVTLERMSMEKDKNGDLAFPHYANALAASTPENYIGEVSKTWSTDPERALKCIGIFNQYTKINSTQES